MGSVSVATYRELTDKYGYWLMSVLSTEIRRRNGKRDEASLIALDFERDAYIMELGKAIYRDWAETHKTGSDEATAEPNCSKCPERRRWLKMLAAIIHQAGGELVITQNAILTTPLLPEIQRIDPPERDRIIFRLVPERGENKWLFHSRKRPLVSYPGAITRLSRLLTLIWPRGFQHVTGGVHKKRIGIRSS